MLSLFPELLFLSPLAALLIRLSVAAVFAYSASMRIPHATPYIKIFGVVDAIIALALFAGFSTQLAALAAVACLAYWLVKKDMNPVSQSTAALALVMALTLLVTGPGPFAFDLPL